MALVYEATLTPSKLELLAEWLPTRSWFRNRGELVRLGSYRFDDPAGEVGIEVILVQSGESLFQVPLTYRGAPLQDARLHLVGTMQHSVLGTRWIYDGCGDPVAVAALAAATLTGASEAIVEVEVEGRMVGLPSAVAVRGSGEPGRDVPAVESVACHDDGAITTVATGGFRLDVAREVGISLVAPLMLFGSWAGRTSVPLVGAATF
jgi:hypothetical protein